MAKTYHKRGKKIDGYWARKHPSYNTWANMKSRCTNPNETSYKNYGARGIDYCERWEQFENFCNDMGMRPSNNHTIERVDNDKGYSPENCVWATRTEQCLNRRKFSNNTSGFVGVGKRRSRYIASYDEGHKRYKIGGTFKTAKEAFEARNKLISALASGKNVDAMLERPSRYDCVSGVRGITKGPSGYIVRLTDDKGKRIYLGHFANLKDAKRRIETWKADNS